MNRLLLSLQNKNQLSISSLRRLYHRLAVKSHPDAPQGSETAFVRLQEEHDEALRYLLGHQVPPVRPQQSTVAARERFLKMLYLYSVVYGSRNWQEFLSRLIEVAFEYRRDVGELLTDYRAALVPALLKKDYLTYLQQTHRILLSSITTLAWLFENDLPFERRLLKSYLVDLDERAAKLDGKVSSVVSRLSVLLQREAQGQRVSLTTIGTMELGRRRR